MLEQQLKENRFFCGPAVDVGDGLKASNHEWSAGGGHSVTVSDGTYTNTAGGSSIEAAIATASDAVKYRQRNPDSFDHIISDNGTFAGCKTY